MLFLRALDFVIIYFYLFVFKELIIFRKLKLIRLEPV